MEYENDMEEEKELSDITVFYSPNLNTHFTLKTIESDPSEQQPDFKDLDCNITIKFFPAEFVGWEEGDMSYGVLMDMLEIEWEIEAEEEKREVQEESLIQRNFQRDRNPMLQVRKVQVNRDLKIKDFLESKFRKLSTELVAKMNWLTSQQVKIFCMSFIKFLIKQSKQENSKIFGGENKGRARGLSIAICEQQQKITGFKLWIARNHLSFNFLH